MKIHRGLCLNCGEINKETLLVCHNCHFDNGKKVELSIKFSERSYEIDTLEKMGKVIAQIYKHVENEDERIPTFTKYMSTHFPDILSNELDEEEDKKALEHLEKMKSQGVDFEKLESEIREKLRKWKSLKRLGFVYALFVFLGMIIMEYCK